MQRWWAHSQARQIDALEDLAAGEAWLARRAASPFAVVVDATLGTSLVADLRRRLEARLAQLRARRQQSLDAAAAELAGQAGVADRKHRFVKKWRRIHAKTLPIPQLEALLAEAEEVVRRVCVSCVCVCACRVCVVLLWQLMRMTGWFGTESGRGLGWWRG